MLVFQSSVGGFGGVSEFSANPTHALKSDIDSVTFWAQHWCARHYPVKTRSLQMYLFYFINGEIERYIMNSFFI